MSHCEFHAPVPRYQTGLAYVEVLVAAAIIALALVPIIEALQTGMLGTEIYKSATAQHYAVLAKMEELLAEPHATLISGAAVAGDPSTPSNYSDPPATPDRRLVFLGLYDADNADGDNDLYTVADPDLDGDGNVYTGYTGLVWVRVEIAGSVHYMESLSAQ
ncbi:MAG: hypothetical protein OEQ74_02665 [Gammaproteobacteria bacterium]|nr:hypothetical protein [Gammaproteobacteria bacterium]